MKYTLKKEVIDAIVNRRGHVLWFNCEGTKHNLPNFLNPFKERLIWVGSCKEGNFELDGKKVPFEVYFVVISEELTIMDKKSFNEIYIRMGDR